MLELGACLTIALPWLTPFAAGPFPGMQPWLLSAACAVLAWLALASNRHCEGQPIRYRFVVVAWLAAALTSSALGLLQYLDLARPFSPWVAVAPLGEAFANLRQRNQLASLTSIGLLALLWWLEVVVRSVDLDALKRRSMAGGNFGTVAAMAALLVACNAATTSRTGLIQLGMLALFALWWPGRARVRRLTLCGVAGAAYLVAALALPVLLEQFTGQLGGSLLARFVHEPLCASRKILWSNVLHLIAQKPWFGWGWGELDYAHFVTLYEGPRFCDILDNAHNLPLHLAVELGVPAALLLCGGVVAWLVRLRPWRESDPTRQLAWGVLAVIGLHSLLEYPLWYGPFQMAVGLSIWLLWTTQKASIEGRGRPKPMLPPTARWLTAVTLLAALAYTAWDYRRISQIYLPVEQRAAAYQDNTLESVRASWLFRNQVRFAELTLTPLSRANAEWTYDAAAALLHYSPEPRVIEKLVESAVLLRRDDAALFYLARYRAAFPAEHARWAVAQTR